MEVNVIRSAQEILQVKEFLRQKGQRYELLFVMGINTALRVGDMLSLSVGDVLDAKGKIASVITLKERKTGKIKRFPVNTSLKSALEKYFASQSYHERSKPLFVSRQGSRLSRIQAWRMLKAAGEFAGLQHIGTHSLRKTFGYHVYKLTGEDIGLVQKLLNHSTSDSTLRYIGIDREQMDNVYRDLNL